MARSFGWRRYHAGFCLFAWLLCLIPCPKAAEFDCVIRNGKIIDGTGNPWRYGDVLLSGDRIAAITPPGSVAPESAREVVDAAGLVICPGFIDILSHSIIPLMREPRSLSKVAQGVTTEVMGEGWTPAPVGGQIKDPFRELSSKYRALISEWAERAREWHRFGDDAADVPPV